MRSPSTIRLLPLVVFALVTDCTEATNRTEGSDLDLRARGLQLVASYFPPPALEDADDNLIGPRAALHLEQMGERPLVGSSIEYAVRVLWMADAFAGDAIIRIEKSINGEPRLVFKRFPAEKVPGSIAITPAVISEKNLSEEDFSRLKEQVQKSQFFGLGNRDQVLVSHGTIWIVEVYDSSRYHVAYCSLGSKPEIDDIGRLVLSLSAVTSKDFSGL